MRVLSEHDQPDGIHRAGSDIERAPAGIANAPFWVEMLVQGNADGALSAMRVFLEPGTVPHWHEHPHGQILYALSGVGLTQKADGSIEELRAGDCVTFRSGERHWHGAAATSPFSYISIQAAEAGRAVIWHEPVEQPQGGAP